MASLFLKFSLLGVASLGSFRLGSHFGVLQGFEDLIPKTLEPYPSPNHFSSLESRIPYSPQRSSTSKSA